MLLISIKRVLSEDIMFIKQYGRHLYLAVNREEDNLHDRYAVTVYLNDIVVGHLPRSISQVS